MKGFERLRLGDISDSCLGKMLDKEKNKGELQPYLANINVRWGNFDFANLNQMRFESHEEERYGLRKNDLVICEGGEPGRCALWKEEVPDMKIQKALHRLRIHAPHDPVFIYYRFLLSGRIGELAKHFSGSTIKHLTGVSLKGIEFNFPSSATQQKIAAVLSALDAKIELNNKINAELEAMAKLLYDTWFVQFDFPISAAQAAALGKPALEGKPYKTSGGKMTQNQNLKRDIPLGWEVKEIGSLCKSRTQSWTSSIHPETVNYVDLANTKNGEIFEIQSFSWSKAPSRARKVLEFGDTIVATVRPGNRSYAFVPHTEIQLTGSTGFAVLRPLSEFSREFLYLTATSDSNIARLAKVADSATSSYPSIKPETVNSQVLACPPDQLLQKLHQVVGVKFALIAKNRIQNQHLTTLRDWLLPMLMNGQVSVYSS